MKNSNLLSSEFCFIWCLMAVLLASCHPTISKKIEREVINTTLDQWHQAAATAKFNDYFNCMAEDAFFLGTDAKENWDKSSFKDFAKPYFDRGRAWNFKALERNIYFGENGQTAWFDELLDTQMKICRGSGVLVKSKGKWNIHHYVLSMTIPNELADSVVQIKSSIEDQLMHSLHGLIK